MKAVVVYYSHSGNTKKVAETIGEELAKLPDLQVEYCQLKPVKEVGQGFGKYLWGGKQVVMKQKPKLKPYRFDNKADLLVLGTPVWAFDIAPPIRAFLAKEAPKVRDVFCFYTCEGGPGHTMETLKKMFDTVPGNFEVLGFDQRAMNVKTFDAEARRWAEEIAERVGK